MTAFVSPSGTSEIVFTDITQFVNALTGAAQFGFTYHVNDSTDASIKLPDAAGARKFKILDSAGTEQWATDSDGEVYFQTTVTTVAGILKHEFGGLELDVSAITEGGLFKGASAGVVEILPKGTADQILQMDATATDFAWTSDTNQQFQFIGAGSSAYATNDLIHIVPVWKDTTGVITHLVVVTILTTTTVSILEYRLDGNEWRHDGVLGRDATVTLNFTTTAAAQNITFFAVDSPGSSTNRILFVAGNNDDATDTFEMDSIDLNDGEGLTATAVTIAGANQPTDTNTMSTVSCAISTSAIRTIFQDDGHSGDVTGDETGFTVTYTTAKVTAIDTSISVDSTAGVTYSMYFIGTQLLLLRNNSTAQEIGDFSMWEMNSSFVLTTEFLDTSMGLGGQNSTTMQSRLAPIRGAFGVTTFLSGQATADRSGAILAKFTLDSFVGNS